MFTISSPTGAAPFWHRASFLGTAAVPVASLVFFIHFTGRRARLTPTRLALLLAIPVVSLVLLWTSAWHGAFFTSVDYERIGRLTYRWEHYGGFYPVYAAYAHALIAAGIGYLIWAAVRAHRPFRSQIIALLIAIIPRLLTSLSETLQLTGYIIVPFGFAAMAVIMSWSIFQYRFLNLLPVARSKLVDTLPDPMFAVDIQDRIIDINPAALGLLGEAMGELAPVLRPEDHVDL